ncbi:MAG TPA: YIP1 family protein [Candidatus Kapabacteria bacterium]|jgi:hypothetical protein|nr:YIP1 family protein [Candidatus Kapabacteria bacterium]
MLAPPPTEMDSPFNFLGYGFLLIILIFLLLNLDRRFRDYMQRALVRPYNFFADIRDQRIIPNAQTGLLLIAESGALLLVLGGLLYSFRSDTTARFFVEHFFPWSWVQNLLWDLSRDPLMLCFLGTLIIAGLLVAIALVVRFAAVFVKGRIYLSDTINVVVWSALPLIFLLPFGMIITRLDRNETLGLTAMWVLVVLFGWIFYRLLKGVAVLFDIYPTRVYLYAGIATAILLVATVLHMDYHHDWLKHLETFRGMLRDS